MITTEALESRRLFSINAYVANGTVFIDGDATENYIHVRKVEDNLVVVHPFDPELEPAAEGYGWYEDLVVPIADVSSIEARLYAGEDEFWVSPFLKQEVTVYGGADRDEIIGGGGTNYLYGYGNMPGYPEFDPANDDATGDNLFAGVGLSFLYGQEGDDSLGTFWSYDDPIEIASAYIYGGDGDDRIQTNGDLDDGKAYVFGEGGNDTLAAGSKTMHWTEFSGGAGFDDIEFNGYSPGHEGVFVDLRDGGGNSGLRVGLRTYDLGSDVEGASGSYYDDVFYGSVRADTFHGGKGNDTMYGGDECDHLYGDDGKDKLYGEKGNDVITGGTGADLMVGGAGDDTFHAKEGFIDMDILIGGDMGRIGSGAADNGFDTAYCDVFDSRSGIDVLK